MEGTDSELEKRAEFCRSKCPVCTRARADGGLARWFVKHIDRKVCPYCRAYEKIYHKKAYE
ncbi:MAG: hypothetical protein ACXQT1_00965 [Methermicoccaceae archaeon]